MLRYRPLSSFATLKGGPQDGVRLKLHRQKSNSQCAAISAIFDIWVRQGIQAFVLIRILYPNFKVLRILGTLKRKEHLSDFFSVHHSSLFHQTKVILLGLKAVKKQVVEKSL